MEKISIIGEQRLMNTNISIDQANWPLLIVTTPTTVEDEELEQFLASYSDVITSRGERYGLVLDVSQTKKLNPAQRRKLTNVMEQNREFNKEHCACCAMVFNSIFIKGILTAIFWVHKPPHPTKPFTEREDAIKWAKTMIRNHPEAN